MNSRISYEQYKNRDLVRSASKLESIEHLNRDKIELRERLMDGSSRDIISDNHDDYDETRAELRAIGHNLVPIY